jgi:hypothetical protein
MLRDLKRREMEQTTGYLSNAWLAFADSCDDLKDVHFTTALNDPCFCPTAWKEPYMTYADKADFCQHLACISLDSMKSGHIVKKNRKLIGTKPHFMYVEISPYGYCILHPHDLEQLALHF